MALAQRAVQLEAQPGELVATLGQCSLVWTVTGDPVVPAAGTQVHEQTGELGSVPSGVKTAGPRHVNGGVPRLLQADATAGVVP